MLNLQAIKPTLTTKIYIVCHLHTIGNDAAQRVSLPDKSSNLIETHSPPPAMADKPPQQQPLEGSTTDQVVRSKLQKLDPSQGAPTDMVRLLPLSKQADLLAKGWRPVQLSKHDKAPGMTLSDDQRAVTSCKGYRMVCVVGVMACC